VPALALSAADNNNPPDSCAAAMGAALPPSCSFYLPGVSEQRVEMQARARSSSASRPASSGNYFFLAALTQACFLFSPEVIVGVVARVLRRGRIRHIILILGQYLGPQFIVLRHAVLHHA
jgi:hypothetical protein